MALHRADHSPLFIPCLHAFAGPFKGSEGLAALNLHADKVSRLEGVEILDVRSQGSLTLLLPPFLSWHKPRCRICASLADLIYYFGPNERNIHWLGGCKGSWPGVLLTSPGRDKSVRAEVTLN